MLDTASTDNDMNQIYVLANFFSPKKQIYVTCLVDEENDLQFYSHKLIAGKRVEIVPNF